MLVVLWVEVVEVVLVGLEVVLAGVALPPALVLVVLPLDPQPAATAREPVRFN